MSRSHAFAIIVSAVLASLLPLSLQAAAAVPNGVAATSVTDAATRQFDFLLGNWTIVVHPRVSSLVAMVHGTPKLVGSWRAWRSPDGGGIDDELRIVDGSGNPISFLRSHRAWNAATQRWKITGSDTTRARSSTATARWVGNEMHTVGRYGEADGGETLTRTRYYAIGPNGFRMVQDRSDDHGATWEEGSITIDATRAAGDSSR